MSFSPIRASEHIYDKYKRYLQTIFSIDNENYNLQFQQMLEDKTSFAKGPYLEVQDSFEKGKSITEQIGFAPDNAGKGDVKWSSSDTSVVTADGGCIEAVGLGTATVKVVLTDDPTIFDTCEVTVINPLKAIVTFDESLYKIEKGNKQKIGYYIYPHNAEVSEMNYESSDPDKVSIGSKSSIILFGDSKLFTQSNTYSRKIEAVIKRYGYGYISANKKRSIYFGRTHCKRL